MSLKLSFRCWDITIFFQFSRWLPLPSWIFEIVKFYWLLGCRGSSRIGMPNFVKIGQLIAKILRFFWFFKMAAAAIWDCQVCKMLLANRVYSIQPHYCTIDLFRQNWLYRCGYIAISRIFKMTDVRYLGFVCGIFGPPTVSTWVSLSLCKIWLWSTQ